jgi:hypothetical protein
LKGYRNQGLGLDYDFILGANIPEMALVAPSNRVLRSGYVAALFDNLINNFFKVALNAIEWIRKCYFPCATTLFVVKLEGEGDETVFEGAIWVVFTRDNLGWEGISISLETLDEVDVPSARLSNEFSHLVGHQSRNRLEESLALVVVEVFQFFSEDVNGALVPV